MRLLGELFDGSELSGHFQSIVTNESQSSMVSQITRMTTFGVSLSTSGFCLEFSPEFDTADFCVALVTVVFCSGLESVVEYTVIFSSCLLDLSHTPGT